MLGYLEFENVYQQASKKLYQSMILANRTDDLIEYLEQFNIKISDSFRDKSKILVLGYSHISKKELLEVAKEFNISEKDIEFYIEKEEIKSFDCKLLKCNKYKAVIVGELPHKLTNLEGKESNLLKEIKSNPKEYSNCIVARNSNKVRITKMSFKNALARIFVN